ncbi:hypothetical protein B0H14DRAFT_3146664 [Mycena olivaceomarginata]|nr:hypothetical protein B0H14DRAFT_3146664 [Mycena olivaceomarginata]
MAWARLERAVSAESRIKKTIHYRCIPNATKPFPSYLHLGKIITEPAVSSKKSRAKILKRTWLGPESNRQFLHKDFKRHYAMQMHSECDQGLLPCLPPLYKLGISPNLWNKASREEILENGPVSKGHLLHSSSQCTPSATKPSYPPSPAVLITTRIGANATITRGRVGPKDLSELKSVLIQIFLLNAELTVVDNGSTTRKREKRGNQNVNLLNLWHSEEFSTSPARFDPRDCATGSKHIQLDLNLGHESGLPRRVCRVLPPSVAVGAANPRRPSLLPLPTTAPPLSLISVIRAAWPAIEKYWRNTAVVTWEHMGIFSSYGNRLSNRLICVTLILRPLTEMVSLANEHKRLLNGLSCNSSQCQRVHQHRVLRKNCSWREGSGVDLELIWNLPPSTTSSSGRLNSAPGNCTSGRLGRPPAADHVALGSAALGRGAADTPSVA